MIGHPFHKDKDGQLSARDFARAYIGRKLWEAADCWKDLVDPAVLEALESQERRSVSEEIFHLVRTIELKAGLVEVEDQAPKWEGGPAEFSLKEKHCHPGTRVKLVRVKRDPERYAIQLVNSATGEFIQSLKSYSLEGGMEVAISMGFSEPWLLKIGVRKDHGQP